MTLRPQEIHSSIWQVQNSLKLWYLLCKVPSDETDLLANLSLSQEPSVEEESCSSELQSLAAKQQKHSYTFNANMSLP